MTIDKQQRTKDQGHKTNDKQQSNLIGFSRNREAL